MEEDRKDKILKEVFKKIDELRPYVIYLQREMVCRPALGPENGGDGEHEKAEFLWHELKSLSPDMLEDIRAMDDRVSRGYRPNIVAIWKGSGKGKRRIWVLGHMDIVPPGDSSLWKTDPYTLVVKDDILIGRGVEDNNHGIISPLLAIKAIKEQGLNIENDICLVLVSDEETGSRYGLEYLLDKRPELFSPEDIIIVPDGGNEDGTMIEIAEKSMLWIKFTVLGKQCHASTPEKGKNSLLIAAHLILKLKERLQEKFNLKDPLFSPPYSTFEPTKIEANVPNVNTIPGRDIFYMDCRILPSYRVDEVIEEIRKIKDEISTSFNSEIQIETHYLQDAPMPTPQDSLVVKMLKEAIRYVKGREAKPMGIGGGTVAAFFRKRGLPAAVWVTMPDSAHQPNEYCHISSILNDAKVFSYLFLSYELT